jgi:plastocyanin
MTPTTKGEPALHAVHINIDGTGFLYTNPDRQNASTIVVRKGDRVKWRCDQGNFSVLFKAQSPFADIALHGRKGNETVTATVVGLPGSYQYAVTVSLDNGLIVDDPIVIIDGD